MKHCVLEHPVFAYGILALVLMTPGMYLVYTDVGGAHTFPPIAYSIVETLVVISPYWLATGRWRVILPVISWVISICLVVNLSYFRFWGHMMPFYHCFQVFNVNSLLLESALAVLRPWDTVIAIPPVVLTALWFNKSFRSRVVATQVPFSKRLYPVLITIVLYTLQISGYTYRLYKKGIERVANEKPYTLSYQLKRIVWPSKSEVATHLLVFQNSGFNINFFHEILASFPKTISLTVEERESLWKYMNAQCAINKLSENSCRNLIFIIVESLDADMIDLTVGNDTIAKNLFMLSRDSGILSSNQVTVQVANGHSCDGQYIYNCGLLPVTEGITSFEYVPRYRDLPSFPRLLGQRYSSCAVFAGDGNSWGESETYVRYGYDDIYTNKDIREAIDSKSKSTDGAMLEYALAKAKEMPQPFFMELLTIQMHLPCTEKVAPATDYAGTGISEDRQRYLNCTADFDRHLGKFIKGLKDSGLWDNTVLVIASDHNLPDTRKPDGTRGDIVFIAANCGITERIGTPVAQVDVFPTVLDIMGVESKWRGVGRSMLGPRRGERDARQQSVSDSIIRSDFFK